MVSQQGNRCLTDYEMTSNQKLLTARIWISIAELLSTYVLPVEWLVTLQSPASQSANHSVIVTGIDALIRPQYAKVVGVEDLAYLDVSGRVNSTPEGMRMIIR